MKISAVIGTFTLATAFSVASATAARSAMSPGSQDARFAALAAQGGTGEVTLAKLALQQAQSPAVKSFARRMIADHGKAGTKLTTIASAEHIPLPAGLTTSDAAARQRLTGLHGAAFDDAYLSVQLTGHRKIAALMQSEIAEGHDAQLVAFAKATLPTVKAHLSLDEADAAAMKRM